MLLFYLFYIIIFSNNIIYSKIEDISTIFSFDLINKYKKESNSIIIDSYSTFIFPNNISLINNLLINEVSNKTLISTNLSNSIFLSTQNSTEEDNSCLKKLINNSQFEFQSCEVFNFSASQSDNEIYHLFYKVIAINKSNSIIEYDSIFALQSLSNVSMVIIDYIDNNLKIIKIF